MKVALAQIAPRLGDTAWNLRLHAELLGKARGSGAKLAIFPELSLTGYSLQDLVRDVAESPGRGRSLAALAGASRRCAVVAGFVEAAPGAQVHNSAACFSGGSLLHVHRKVYLPTYGMFDEGRYFAPGEGFRVFDAPWGRTGLLVCEDFWHLSSSWLLAAQGMELLIVISASPAKGLGAARRPKSLGVWEDLARVVARHLGCWVAYVNRVGYEDGWAFQGGSLLCSPSGEVEARAGFLDEELLVVELRPADLRRARIRSPLFRDEKRDLVGREIERILREEGDRPALPGRGRRR